jgi:hypothetical protein
MAHSIFSCDIYLTFCLSVSASRLVTMTWTLVAWLHLTSSLSRDTGIITLKFIYFLLTAAFHLGSRLRSTKPEDVIKQRTTLSTIMIQLSLDPDLERHICCPKCFKIYPDAYEEDKVTPIYQVCDYQESTRSRPCNTALYTMRHIGGARPRLVPVRCYTTQNFKSWITWFLSRPEIESALDASYAPQPRTTDSPMHDVWDSPAWHKLGERGNFCTTRGNLTFSYYVDWFNPFLNKIGGKHVSCGAIVMVCLNLPPKLRHKPENVFIASIIPPNREPDVVTFTHVADPVIDQLVPFYAGQAVPTFSHPDGETIRIAVLPFIGDIPAVRKAAGFASHSAQNFCSFCTCTKDNVECLDPRQWTYRDHWSCRNYALQWLDAKTKVLRTLLFKLYGVRWSSLYRLAYRDHVKHTMLGIMHCWLEGVLQHHTRYLWGLGNITLRRRKLERRLVTPTTILRPQAWRRTRRRWNQMLTRRRRRSKRNHRRSQFLPRLSCSRYGLPLPRSSCRCGSNGRRSISARNAMASSRRITGSHFTR